LIYHHNKRILTIEKVSTSTTMTEETPTTTAPTAADAVPEAIPSTIPTTMKRLVVTAPGKDVASCTIEIEEVPVPKPGSGEVLIKVAAAAINPSDYMAWAGCKPEQCPFAMGTEGSGVVVATGEGYATTLSTFTCKVGTKVGFIGLKNKQGAYSEYVVASAMESVFTLPDDLPVEDAASFFVNPYTVVGIIDTAKEQGAKALIHTAAASQLGQMLVKFAPTEGMEIINVVRREEQAELLKTLGAKHVIVTGSGDAWKEELKAKVEELGATVAFDAIAGQSAGDLLDVLPPKGTVNVYGGLAGRVANVDPLALIYHEKKLKGFYLSAWIQHGGTLSMLYRLLTTKSKVNSGLKQGGWSSTQFKDTKMESAQADIVKLLDSSITGQKLRIRFDSE
jgi:NADPH2:quinone reductase